MSADPTPTAMKTAGTVPVPVAYLFLMTTALLWAGTAIAGRLAAAGEMPPLAVSFWRWTGALVIFLCIGGRNLMADRRVILAHWKMLTVFAFFGVFLFSTFYLVGVQLTTATNVTLLNSTGPVLILLCAFAILRSPISGRQWLGIALASSGATTIVLRGHVAAILDLRLNIGDLLVLGAFLSWAIYTALLKWRPAGVDQTSFLITISGIGVVMTAPLYAWEYATVGGFETSWANLGTLGYLMVFPSVVGYYLWNSGIGTLGANRGSFAQYLIPVFGVVLAMTILGEEVESYHLAGVLLILAGVYLATTKRRAQRRD